MMAVSLQFCIAVAMVRCCHSYEWHGKQIMAATSNLAGKACEEEVKIGVVGGGVVGGVAGAAVVAPEGVEAALLKPEAGFVVEMGGAAFGMVGGVLVGVELGVTACAATATLSAAAAAGGLLLDTAAWAGVSIVDDFGKDLYSATHDGPPMLKPSPEMLVRMKIDLAHLEEDFKQLSKMVQKFTKYVKEARWSMATVLSQIMLNHAHNMKDDVQDTFGQAHCDQPDETCPEHYWLQNGDNFDRCQQAPFICYDACCKEQKAYCQTDHQCMTDRGCGPDNTPQRHWKDKNCDDLRLVRRSITSSIGDLASLKDCACKLKNGIYKSPGCSPEAEQLRTDTLNSDWGKLHLRLNALTALYNVDAVNSDVLLLGAPRDRTPMTQPSNHQIKSACTRFRNADSYWSACVAKEDGVASAAGSTSWFPSWRQGTTAFIVFVLLNSVFTNLWAFCLMQRTKTSDLQTQLIPKPFSCSRRCVLVVCFWELMGFAVVMTIVLVMMPEQSPEQSVDHCGSNYEIARQLRILCADLVTFLEICPKFTDDCLRPTAKDFISTSAQAMVQIAHHLDGTSAAQGYV